MSKPLLALIGSIVVVGFVYMHFEWFPAHTGPKRAEAQAQILEWAREVSGQANPHITIADVDVPDANGIAAAEISFHNFYYEYEGAGLRYSGRGRAEFVRVGPMFRPRWVMTRVELLDRQPPAVLRASMSQE